MGSFIDRTGQVFGNLTVLNRVPKSPENPSKKTMWFCECTCGFVFKVDSSNLVTGNTTKCKVCRAEGNKTHGMWNTSTYLSWQHMKARCSNPNLVYYENYGGRGISVCQRWVNSFENFLEDMGICPEGLTLDRYDVDGDYEPSNCSWKNRSYQSYNRRPDKSNTSGKEGVYLRSDTNKWSSYINVEGKRHNLGCYVDYLDAVKAREDAEIKYYGEKKHNKGDLSERY